MTPFAPWLHARSDAEAIIAAWAADCWDAGLSVYRQTDDTVIPIPLVVDPEVIDDAVLDQLVADARVVLDAAVRIACAVFSDPAYAFLWAGFTELERKALRPQSLMQVATARVDCFTGTDGRDRVLELNATIPAMQGYSDIATHRWIRAVGAARGLPDGRIGELIAANGSNTADLRAALDASWRAMTGSSGTPSILVVSRPGDAQIGELRHYVRTWSTPDHPVANALAEEVAFDDRGRPVANGVTYDLLYRHIFARRIAPDTALARALIAGNAAIRNPITSLLEVKGLLAVLDAAAAGELACGEALTAEEREVVRRRVPWTRMIGIGPAWLADGTYASDLRRWVQAHSERVVVKKSWDYGGKSVFIGPEASTEGSRAKMVALYGSDCRDWSAFIDRAAVDDEPWVVQEFIDTPSRRMGLVNRENGRVVVRSGDVHVDRNAYANLIDTPIRGPGVTRASGGRIVNILGGGGLVPVLRRSVYDGLFG